MMKRSNTRSKLETTPPTTPLCIDTNQETTQSSNMEMLKEMMTAMNRKFDVLGCQISNNHRELKESLAVMESRITDVEDKVNRNTTNIVALDLSIKEQIKEVHKYNEKSHAELYDDLKEANMILKYGLEKNLIDIENALDDQVNRSLRNTLIFRKTPQDHQHEVPL